MGYVAYKIYHTYTDNDKILIRSFDSLQASARAFIKSSADATGETWQNASRREYMANPNTLSIVIRDSVHGIRFMLPKKNPWLIVPANASESTVKTDFWQAPFTTKVLSSRLVYLPDRVISIDALYSLISQREVFNSLIEGFGLICSWSFICLIVIVINRGHGRRKASATVDDGDETSSHFPEAEKDHEIMDPISKASGFSTDDMDFSIPDYIESDHAQFDVPVIPEEINQDHFPRFSDTPFTEQQQDRNPAEPQGLYSPASGLGWQSYMTPRLDAELSRSASFEQDIVLLLLVHDLMQRGDETYKLVSRLTLGFFSFQDLMFELGENGFAVILPNINLDHGVRMAEEFFKKITFALKDKNDALSYLDFHIGLSARSGRLISADRILGEAASALDKARNDHDSHIVAFLPDPDKYRSFIQDKNGQ